MTPELDLSELTLSHPHDFFRVKHLSIQPGTCFVLMPFAEEFTLVFDTIRAALKGLMVCTRADDLHLGESILERILLGIATSELIIADLSGQNPNVFYELAIAHSRTKNVLLLAKQMQDVPFDLRPFFCHRYSVTSQAGVEALKAVVLNGARKVLSKRLEKPLDSAINRTQRIVDYMSDLTRRPDECKRLVIRVQANISSLGNSTPRGRQRGEAAKYGDLLEEERELLIELIQNGASLQAVLSPHQSIFGNDDRAERRRRITRVVRFLENPDLSARCQVALSPMRGPNLLFFGEEILFEGHKTKVERGFDLTLVYTDPYTLRLRAAAFDKFLESAKAFTLQRYRTGNKRRIGPEELRKAVLIGLQESIEAVNSRVGTPHSHF